MKDGARLRMIGQIGLESAAILRSPSPTSRSPRSVVALMTQCNGDQPGSKQTKLTTRYMAAASINSGFTGLVGPESHRCPAVVEPAAVRSGPFTEVHEPA